MSKNVTEKVQLLSRATTTAEAQAAFTASPQAKPQPKTFNHAIARASLAGSQLLHQSDVRGAGADDSLAQALEKYAVAEERVGEARLTQDERIQRRFLAGWSATLNTNLQFAQRARKNVENARLNLDATKARVKGINNPFNNKAQSHGEENYTEAQRAEIEKAEDEFVNQTEEAVGVMKNVLDTPEPLKNLAELIAAQLEFHKRAYEILSELAPEVDQLQLDQEVSSARSTPPSIQVTQF